MSMLGLTLAYLRQRPLTTLLNTLLLALGVATVVALLLFAAQLRDRLARDAKGIELVDLDTLLASSDYLSIHCPVTDETTGLFNKETFAKMKPALWWKTRHSWLPFLP